MDIYTHKIINIFNKIINLNKTLFKSNLYNILVFTKTHIFDFKCIVFYFPYVCHGYKYDLCKYINT